MTVYYNEFDKQTAAWLRMLIAHGHIAPGVVDERSIEDVRPSDLRGFTQCHFFAGIGVWSYALRRAGWRDDRPIWTGSCPCQPFSAAGKGAGFDDERHLWPAFHHLIRECKPASVVGEQVASKDVDAWIDLVHADLEALGYAFGSVPFPSSGVGAPHIRDRNYWAAVSGNRRDLVSDRNVRDVGDTSGQGLAQRQRQRGILGYAPRTDKGKAAVGASVCDVVGLADDNQHGRTTHTEPKFHDAEYHLESRGSIERLADDELQQRQDGQPGVCNVDATPGREQGTAEITGLRGDLRTGPTNGYWASADWLGCRDGKWRPVEPGTFPLVDGAAARVVRLRGYGNAVNAEAAKAWIETVMECLP